MGKIRTRGIAETKQLISPYDSEVEFVIKKASNREDVARSNLFAKVRYIVEGEGDEGRVATERELPQGQLQIETIKFCLVGWNLLEKENVPYEVNERNILDLLKPEERVWLFNEILKFNPVWSGREAEGNDSEKS